MRWKNSAGDSRGLIWAWLLCLINGGSTYHDCLLADRRFEFEERSLGVGWAARSKFPLCADELSEGH